ncbi:MAG: hypothetical protein EZS28_021014 [Streblomastix strix]|uniref:Uncharacterized protein n=1 Tax=Streblomastix strix TaxID=222440 RepID=A0A5J4VLI7_9EUKA|nr:MAG: hypothetical protein EZS28_021014 [Streblomastix strix]
MFIYAFISTQTYYVSILAILGMLQVVIDKAREAKREGKEYGGSFMIFGEAETEQENNEIALRRKVELMSKYKQSFEEVENQQKEQIEIENQKHRERKNKNLRQINQLNQEIKTQEQSEENAIQKLSESSPEQKIILDREKDQEIGEKLRNMSDQVNETDKLVEIRRHELDNLEQEAQQQRNEIQGLRKLSNNQQQSNKRDEQKDQQESDEEIISSRINKKEKLKENDKEKQRKKEKEKEKEKKKQNEKEKEKEIKRETEEEIKRKNENIIQKITIDKKEGSFEDKQNQEVKQEILIQKEKIKKVQEIEIDKEKQRKKEIGIDNNSISNITTRTLPYEFQTTIFKYLAVLDKQRNGGIAIVRGNEEIPQMISFNEMINLKGIVFALPYVQIWKRTDNIERIIEQQSSTSHDTQSKTQDLDKWIHLNLQLDFETEERIAKFFIGKDMNEFVGVGIKKLPKDIKVVVMSQGPLKAYMSEKQNRRGDEITELVPFSV